MSINHCSGKIKKGTTCENKVYNGEVYCYLHMHPNKAPQYNGFAPFSYVLDEYQEEEHAGIRMPVEELENVIRKRQHRFDDGHMEVLRVVRREMQYAVVHGMDPEHMLNKKKRHHYLLILFRDAMEIVHILHHHTQRLLYHIHDHTLIL